MRLKTSSKKKSKQLSKSKLNETVKVNNKHQSESNYEYLQTDATGPINLETNESKKNETIDVTKSIKMFNEKPELKIDTEEVINIKPLKQNHDIDTKISSKTSQYRHERLRTMQMPTFDYIDHLQRPPKQYIRPYERHDIPKSPSKTVTFLDDHVNKSLAKYDNGTRRMNYEPLRVEPRLELSTTTNSGS